MKRSPCREERFKALSTDVPLQKSPGFVRKRTVHAHADVLNPTCYIMKGGKTLTNTLLRVAALAAASSLAAACASSSDNVAASYVSPVMYQGLSCSQLSYEAQRVSSAAAAAAGVQDSQRTKDAVVTTAAIVVFWPAAFFVGGDNAKTAELARLKGEMQAIEAASIQKRCGMTFRRG